MKVCPSCLRELPFSQFYRHSRTKTLYRVCKSCAKERSRAWRQANTEATRRHALSYYQRKTPEERHARLLWTKYRLSPEEYAALLIRQGGSCAVCEWKPDEGNTNLRVDHDHSCCTGDRSCGNCVRGLLCHNCNVALGHARDDPSLLRKLAAYLERREPEC